jgi:Golgi apparatus protein 1
VLTFFLECLRSLFHDRLLDKAGDGPGCQEAVATLIEFTNADIHTDPVLHDACSLDLSKFCREVPQGNSQQLKCLALVLHDPKLKLEQSCSDLLQKRMEMFNMALKVVPIQGLQDLLVLVSQSHQRNYFLMLVGGFFSLIFIVGLLCGRVTKRVKREMKNR